MRCAQALLHMHMYTHEGLSIFLPWAHLTGLSWTVLWWVRSAFLPTCHV